MGKQIVRMAGRVAGPRGSWRRRWSIVISLVIAVGLAIVVKQNVLAVHDGTAFELDTPTGSPTPPGGPGANVTTDDPAKDDWDEVCFAETGDAGCGTNGALDATVTATMWSADCPGGFVPPQGGSVLDCGDFTVVPAAKDASVFTGGGSKDPEPIENWLWKNMAVPQKNNLVHAFAVRYSRPSSSTCPGPGGDITGTTKCDVLYFGSDRWDNDGSAQQGFWFLQDKIGLNGAPGGGATHFTGSHKPDDVLVLSDFTQGGVISTITVYKWDPPRINPAVPGTFIGCASTGNAVDPTNIKKSVNDGTCGAANLRRLTPAGGAANCYGATADPFCGVVNEVDATSEPPWTFRDAENSLTYRTNELLEAGVNLSAFPGLSGKCFASIVAESRASGSSFTATNQDFVLGAFGECITTLTTEAELSSGGPYTIGLGSTTSGTDTAKLKITGTDTWAGTLDFYLCGPFATQTLCSEKGYLVDSKPVASTDGTDTYISDTATLTAAGNYCWFAKFTPNAATAAAGVSGATHDGSPASPNKECFVIAKVAPSLDTSAGPDVVLGNYVTDTATLSNLATEPGTRAGGGSFLTIDALPGPYVGTITFSVFGPTSVGANFCTTAASSFAAKPPIDLSQTVVGKGNGDYTAQFAPSTVGDFHWKASISGVSLNNVLPQSHNDLCTDVGEGGEDVTVIQIETRITTAPWAIPNDDATISAASGNLPEGGSVVFRLYGPAVVLGVQKTALQNCQANEAAGVKYTQPPVAVKGGGASETVSTTNTGAFKILFPNFGTTYYWRVEYTPGGVQHTGRQSACVEEITVNGVAALNPPGGVGFPPVLILP